METISYDSIQLSKQSPFLLDTEKIILFVNDRMFGRMMDIIAIDSQLNDTDIIVSLISYGDLVFKYNQINKHLVQINKP